MKKGLSLICTFAILANCTCIQVYAQDNASFLSAFSENFTENTSKGNYNLIGNSIEKESFNKEDSTLFENDFKGDNDSYVKNIKMLINVAKKYWIVTKDKTKKVKSVFKEIGEFGESISGIGKGIAAIPTVYLIAKQGVKFVKMKLSRISSNVDKVTCSLDKELHKLRGQEKAKKKMKEIVSAIIDARNEASEIKKPYKKGDVIYMVGPSGVGKTFSADCLARAIMGKDAKPVYIDASDIDKNDSRSIKEQLFYMREGKKRGDTTNLFEDTSLITQIKTNPNVVLIINEYDKMHTSDFDEVLRTIMDRGQICIYSEKIDCSGLLIIVTSNEDHSSITSGNNENNFQDDGTGSRTHVKHDKSFLNRLNIIEFENLNKDAYEEIATDVLNDIAKRYHSKYSVNLKFGDTAKKIAQKAENTNQGAREIEKTVAGLKTAIVKARQDSQKISSLFNNKTYLVDYNEEKDEFILEDMSKNKNNSEFEPSKEKVTKEDEEFKANEKTNSTFERIEKSFIDPVLINSEYKFNLDDEKYKLNLDDEKYKLNLDDEKYKFNLDFNDKIYTFDYDKENDKYVCKDISQDRNNSKSETFKEKDTQEYTADSINQETEILNKENAESNLAA